MWAVCNKSRQEQTAGGGDIYLLYLIAQRHHSKPRSVKKSVSSGMLTPRPLAVVLIERVHVVLLSRGATKYSMVEVVFLHLTISLVSGPPVVRDSIDSCHSAGAMSSTFAVHVDGPILRVVHKTEKVGSLLRGSRAAGLQRDVEIPHA